MEPDNFIRQDYPKSSTPYRKIFVLLIILIVLGLGILIYLGLTLYKDKIPLPFLNKTTKPSSDQSTNQAQLIKKDKVSSFETSLSEIMTTVHISKSGPAEFIKKESISSGTHFNNITEKPKSNKDYYTFLAELITPDQQTLYYSWKQFPIVRSTDGGFDIKILVPYSPDSVLKITNEQGDLVISMNL